jgi:hypothetical protein
VSPRRRDYRARLADLAQAGPRDARGRRADHGRLRRRGPEYLPWSLAPRGAATLRRFGGDEPDGGARECDSKTGRVARIGGFRWDDRNGQSGGPRTARSVSM